MTHRVVRFNAAIDALKELLHLHVELQDGTSHYATAFLIGAERVDLVCVVPETGETYMVNDYKVVPLNCFDPARPVPHDQHLTVM